MELFLGDIWEWLSGIFLIIFVIARGIIYEFGIAIICGLIAFVALIVICRSIKRKKRKKVRVFAVIMGVCLAFGIIWYILFPTAFPYVDLWILGKTEEEIIEVYGEPRFEPEESHGGNKMAYYTRTIIFEPDYYMIIFEDGKAVGMEEGVFPHKGG